MDSATPQRQSVLLTKTPILIVLVVIVALAIHIGLVLRVYPPRVLLAGEPPHIGDVSRHFATAHASAHVRGLYGYDPYFMAGYPVGLWNSMGKKGFEMLQRLIPWLPLPALFYGILVGISIASPLILWIGLLRFVRDNRDRAIFLAVILVFWHLHSMIAYFWGFGNVFFPGMACLLPVAVGCTWDMAELRRPFLMALVFSLLVYDDVLRASGGAGGRVAGNSAGGRDPLASFLSAAIVGFHCIIGRDNRSRLSAVVAAPSSVHCRLCGEPRTLVSK